MNKTKFVGLIKSVEKTLIKHSPEILTGIGIAGAISSTVLAVKATPKAIRLIEEKKKETKTEKLPGVEILKTTWKCYAPSAVTGILSYTCLIGACSVNTRRNAAIAAAYKLSETALSEYKESVIETVGEETEKEIRDKVAKKKVSKDVPNKSDIIITEKGNTLCFDPLSGRYFKSDAMKIKKAENSINESILVDAFNAGVSLNDFYNEIGLPPTNLGNTLGWNLDNLLNIDFSSQIAGEDSVYEGMPCLVIDYINPPKYNYD